MILNWTGDFFAIGFFSDRFVGAVSVPQVSTGIILIQDTRRRILVR